MHFQGAEEGSLANGRKDLYRGFIVSLELVCTSSVASWIFSSRIFCAVKISVSS